MLNSENGSVEWTAGHFGRKVYRILVLDLIGDRERIMDGHMMAESLEFIVQIEHFGIADVRTVLLERKAQNKNTSAVDAQPLPQHRFDDVLSNEARHAVVDAPAGQNHLRMKTNLLGFMR